MRVDIREKIFVLLFEKGGKGLTEPEIISLIGKKKDNKIISRELEDMKRFKVLNYSKLRYSLKNPDKYHLGEVTRSARSHGFVRLEDSEEGEEVFVRGKDCHGAVPGDRVLVKIIADKDEFNRSQTAVVTSVLEFSSGMLTGVVVDHNGEIRLQPSTFSSPVPLAIVGFGEQAVRVGDKVRFEIKKRGERHSEHVATITEVFGSSDVARVSVKAYIEEKQIPTEFPEAVVKEAKEIEKKGIPSSEKAMRTDLRDLPIFTVDGADTKDIDDAVSIEKTPKGYKLGVHIADVSHYVKKGTALDQEANKRGTSVYIADMVIPMLPKELSNGICSLNPKEERLAFSCLMELDANGEINKYRFVKSLIRSRVKGVYSEVNKIIAGEEDEEIKEKYAEVIGQIPVMNELAAILKKNREQRGAPEINSVESKIICDENGVCIDIKAREGGVAEGIIEEFMLAANNCAAKVGMSNHIPFVYRVHEAPSAEKLMMLQDTLVAMGINPKGINESSSAKDLAQLLKDCKDDPRAPIIHRMTLRTMMKAKYSENPIGHFGLVMKEYAHFTSPIRRLADLSVHRILTDYVMGEASKLEKRYARFANENSTRASDTEVTAVNAERDCEKFYAAEYMKNHVGEQFEGIISGVINSGIFVELPNTVEGRIDTFTLPEGEYEVKNNIMLVETLSNTVYAMGDRVKVTLSAVNVGAGQIDFVLDEHTALSADNGCNKQNR
ncbi:MAG: ribonuclease R [Bacteroides sp.]|nr:ribonuclease R [Bacteroides sp.]